MNPEKVKSIPRFHRRNKHLSVRVSPDVISWLKKNHFSATKIFYEAIKELGYKENRRKK